MELVAIVTHEHSRPIDRFEQIGRFERRQLAIEDPEVIEPSALESLVPKTLAQGDIVAATAGNILVKVVSDNIGIRKFSVEVKPQATRSARSVPGHRNVRPFLRLNLRLGAHAQRIAWPKVNQRSGYPTLLNE